MGQNPAVGSMHGALHREGAGASSTGWWCATSSLTETAAFWRIGPGDRPRRGPDRGHPDRGLLLPRRGAHREGRHLHQHPAAAPVAPPGGRPARRLPLRPLVHLPPRQAAEGALREAPTAGARPADPDPHLGLPRARARPRTRRAEAVLRGDQRLHRRRLASRVPGFTELKDDGSTACGCWIYSGCFKDGVNQAARRKPRREQTWVAPEWGWAWPANRRLLYNRASADPEGRPWSERKKYVWWDEEQRQVDRLRRPRLHRRPAALLPAGAGRARDRDHRRRTDPFIMQADGKGWLFAPTGLLDGPLPDPLRAGGVARREPPLRPAVQPGRGSSGTGPTTRPTAPTTIRPSPTCSPPTGSPSTTPPAG